MHSQGKSMKSNGHQQNMSTRGGNGGDHLNTSSLSPANNTHSFISGGGGGMNNNGYGNGRNLDTSYDEHYGG